MISSSVAGGKEHSEGREGQEGPLGLDVGTQWGVGDRRRDDT